LAARSSVIRVTLCQGPGRDRLGTENGRYVTYAHALPTLSHRARADLPADPHPRALMLRSLVSVGRSLLAVRRRADCCVSRALVLRRVGSSRSAAPGVLGC